MGMEKKHRDTVGSEEKPHFNMGGDRAGPVPPPQKKILTPQRGCSPLQSHIRARTCHWGGCHQEAPGGSTTWRGGALKREGLLKWGGPLNRGASLAPPKCCSSPGPPPRHTPLVGGRRGRPRRKPTPPPPSRPPSGSPLGTETTARNPRVDRGVRGGRVAPIPG